MVSSTAGAGGGKMGEKTVTITFTPKELNYLDRALMADIKSLELDSMRDVGNVPHIRRFQKALTNKIRMARGFEPCRWKGLIAHWRCATGAGG
jgi:hypothetical protein